MDKFIPQSPDKLLKKDADMSLAKFGHINAIVDQVTANEASILANTTAITGILTDYVPVTVTNGSNTRTSTIDNNATAVNLSALNLITGSNSLLSVGGNSVSTTSSDGVATILSVTEGYASGLIQEYQDGTFTTNIKIDPVGSTANEPAVTLISQNSFNNTGSLNVEIDQIIATATDGVDTSIFTVTQQNIALNTTTVYLQNLPTYADNAAALAGGLIADAVYKTATGELRIVV